MYLACVSFHLFLTGRILLQLTCYEHLTAKKRMRIQYHMLSWNGNPLVDVRTGARHADGRLCGLCTGGVARKLEAEASRGALQRAIASWNGNPLVDVRTGARHADGRLFKRGPCVLACSALRL